MPNKKQIDYTRILHILPIFAHNYFIFPKSYTNSDTNI